MSNAPNNKLFNKNNMSNWIIGGIIALIITKISDLFGKFLFSNILTMGGNFITNISNSTYKEISNGFSEQTSSTTLYLLFLIFISLLLLMYLRYLQNYKKLQYKLIKLLTPNDNSTTVFKESDIVTSNNLQKPDSEILEIQLKKKLHSNKFSFMFDTFVFLVLFLMITFFYGQSSYIRDKTISITNNIEIVSPYITDIEYKQFSSEFHSIETQSDYNALMEKLTTIANEYSLKLK